MIAVELNKEKIEHCIRLVEGALGIEFIEEIKSSLAKAKTENIYSGIKESIHPFALWWSMMQADFLTYSKTKKLSKQTINFLTLALILESISCVKGLNRLLKELKKKHSFLPFMRHT